MNNGKVKSYWTQYTGTDGKQYTESCEFTVAHAGSIGAVITDDGLSIHSAQHLVDMWNARSGSNRSYSLPRVVHVSYPNDKPIRADGRSSLEDMDLEKHAARWRVLESATDLTPFIREYHSGLCLSVEAVDAEVPSAGTPPADDGKDASPNDVLSDCADYLKTFVATLDRTTHKGRLVATYLEIAEFHVRHALDHLADEITVKT